MNPERAAQLFFRLGLAFLLAALLARGMFISLDFVQLRRMAVQPLQPSGDYGSPFLGSYTLSPNGRLIGLAARLYQNGAQTGGPYIFDRTTGTLTSGPLPEAENHFVFQDGQLYARVDGSIPDQPLTAPGMIVGAAGYSPDGQLMAFTSRASPGSMQLYVLSWYYPAQLLLEGPFFSGMAWSPVKIPGLQGPGVMPGAQLAYVSPVDGVDQLFRCVIDGPCPQQLTFDHTRKISPTWSPDGRWIAYLALHLEDTPAVPGAAQVLASAELDDQSQVDGTGTANIYAQRDLYAVAADGSSPHRITPDGEQPFNLAWVGDPPAAPGLPSSEAWLTYTKWLWDVDSLPFSTSRLYGYSTASGLPAEGTAPTRLFPPADIDQIGCPVHLGGEPISRFSFQISNTGPTSLPVLMIARSAGQPIYGLDPKTALASDKVVTLTAGETLRLDWDIPLPPQPVGYVSILLDQGGPFPFAEASCRFTRSWFSMLTVPRLPGLPISLALVLFGTLLALPGLRRRAKWVWLLWGLVLTLFAGLLTAESLLLTHF